MGVNLEVGGLVGKKKSITQRRKGAEQREQSQDAAPASAPPRLCVSPSVTPEEIPYIHPSLVPLALPIESICTDPENENKHDARSIRAIAASLREYGQLKPIVASSKTGFISAGNGTHAAAKTLGWDYIAVVATEHDPETHAAFRITENRTHDFSDFDEELLQKGLSLMKERTPDLFLDLELADLEGATTPAEIAEVEVTPTFTLLIELPTEAAQKKWHDKLVKQGLDVKVRTI